MGPDLRNRVPSTANENLTAQASAIVRSVIANHKLEDLLTDRQTIRAAILDNMKDQVKGWGVWLETVEITDIRILSASLFQDLQARFREKEKEKAEIYTANINDQIAKKRTEYELKMKQVVDAASLDYEVHRQQSNFKIQDAYTKDEGEIAKIREQINVENNQYSIDTMQYENKINMNLAE